MLWADWLMQTIFTANILLDELIFIALSFALTYLITPIVIKFAVASGITGRDVNKPNAPEIAEMGGIAILFGFMGAMLLAIAFHTFFQVDFNVMAVMAGLLTILMMGVLGVIDDIFDIPQIFKAFLPLFAAIPLIAIRAGNQVMLIPFLGAVNFGILYLLILVPIGIAVTSNLTNMLAGFNGLEAGLGAIMFAALLVIAITTGNPEIGIFSASMLGALLAFLMFNRYPARIFPGDAGTFLIGAALATTVIVGNLEFAGAILAIPYVVDFFIKLINRFPSKQWWGACIDGKLHPVDGKVRGLCQWIMKQAGGITENKLVSVLLLAELALALIVMILFK